MARGQTQRKATQAGSDAAKALGDKRIFTTGEAAAICKVSQQTIIRCFDNGRLQGFRVPGSKFRRIPRDELVRFMRTNGIPVEQLEGGGLKRVLIVDDDPRILELFAEVFKDDGRFEIKTASTGYDAGLLTESFRPNLIILDYMLPDVNGNVVCQRIRERKDAADIKVLCVSGVIDEEGIKQLMKAGAHAFMQKPFSIDALMAKVSELLELPAE